MLRHRSIHRAARGQLLHAWFTFLGLLVVLPGCQPQSADPTGGETHFLRVCSNDPSACGTSLSCLCGVCTVACQVAASCSSLPEAQCSVRPDGSCDVPTNICDVPCIADSNCSALSSGHRCVNGSCRLLPVPVSGGEGGAGVSGEACTEGETLANEVLIIGDSFFATSHQITAYLEDNARNASVIEAGERYRDVSRLTANTLALASAGLLDQYTRAVEDAAVKVVIMNGGGADVLLGSCDSVDESCPVITSAISALDTLFLRMAADGVKNVVYVSYPDPGPEEVKAKMDVLRPLTEQSCAGSPVPCSWVDLQTTFSGHHAEFVLADGLNPTAAGSQAAADAIWSLMQRDCIAQ